jgi:hypothetical protein
MIKFLGQKVSCDKIRPTWKKSFMITFLEDNGMSKPKSEEIQLGGQRNAIYRRPTLCLRTIPFLILIDKNI